jgi:hypothetical protein
LQSFWNLDAPETARSHVFASVHPNVDRVRQTRGGFHEQIARLRVFKAARVGLDFIKIFRAFGKLLGGRSLLQMTAECVAHHGKNFCSGSLRRRVM